MLAGMSWNVEFDLNGNHYTNGYYLVDGIYPDWASLIKSKGLLLSDQATKNFTKAQEGKRKEIERAFGILKARFQILAKPALQWYPGDLTTIIKTCIILHNMLVEYQSSPKELPPLPSSIVLIQPCSEPFCPRDRHMRMIEMQSSAIHNRLTSDLIAHLWSRSGKRQVEGDVELESEGESDSGYSDV
jgi:hypothetical protein